MLPGLEAPPKDDSPIEKAETLQPIRLSWMEWFCSLEDHEFVTTVDRVFLSDKFNLLKLDKQVSFSGIRFKDCLKLIAAPKAPEPEDLKNEDFLLLNQDASDVYGLLHARYMRSEEGKFFVILIV